MSLVDLYKDRCARINGKLRPHYWQPQVVPYTKPSLYSDENNICPQEWGVGSVLSRTLAVNKFLEDDGAGYYVGAALRGSEKLPDHPVIKPLLQSNIKDEKFHQKGIDNLCELYSSQKDLEKAKTLASHWRDFIDKYHPLYPVAVLETAVFTPVLGFWRVFGGITISSAAYHISKDEQRHVQTNRSVLNHLGYDVHETPKDLLDLTKQTLEWSFENVSIPNKTTPKFDWTIDNLFSVSKDLLEKDESPAYNETCFYADYIPHFEDSSNHGYGRAVV